MPVGAAPVGRPRPFLALNRLRDPRENPELRWRHWVLRPDEAGRVALPPEARRLLDPPELVRAMSRDAWLLLRPSSVSGTVAELDGRGRVKLPHWLRHACAPSGMVVVAAAVAGAPVVAIAATVVLDSLVDAVAGVAGGCGEVVA